MGKQGALADGRLVGGMVEDVGMIDCGGPRGRSAERMAEAAHTVPCRLKPAGRLSGDGSPVSKDEFGNSPRHVVVGRTERVAFRIAPAPLRKQGDRLRTHIW